MNQKLLNFENISKYFDENQIEKFRESILKSNGAEVFFGIDNEGNIYPIFYGNDDSVIVDFEYIQNYSIIIHNHPSGNLKPSENDNYFARFAAKNGIAFGIINNEVSQIYFVVPPISVRRKVVIEDKEIDFYLSEKNGKIKEIIPSFVKRESQIGMSKVILDAFNQNFKVAIEANTGIGKSFAYLLPIFLNIKYNKIKFLIITNTISLQRQLIEKDIPSMIKITEIDIKYNYLIGRNNYICLYRYQLLKEKEINQTLYNEDLFYTNIIENFIETTNTGILDEIDKEFISKIKNELNSNSVICLRESCKFYSKCFYYNSRKKLSELDLIILNNHLFFLNEMSYEFSEFLPKFYYAVFDEAHNIENCLEDVLTISFDYNYLSNRLNFLFSNDINKEKGILVLLKKYLGNNDNLLKYYVENHYNKLKDKIVIIKEKLSEIFEIFNKIYFSFYEKYNENKFSENSLFNFDILDFYNLIEKENYLKEFKNLTKDFLTILKDFLNELNKLVEEFFIKKMNLQDNLTIKNNLKQKIDIFLFIKKNIDLIRTYLEDALQVIENFYFFEKESYFDNDIVLWVNFNKNNFEMFSLLLYKKSEIINKILENYNSLIFTSATLTIDKKFDYFLKSILNNCQDDFNNIVEANFKTTREKNKNGETENEISNEINNSINNEIKINNFHNIKTFIFDSPFNYQEQSEIMIVKDSPDPNSKEFIEFVSKSILDILLLSEGRAFILTTSYSDLNFIYNFLSNSDKLNDLNILAQNKKYNNNKMIEIFKTKKKSVLIGTMSFWEGVDVPGEALELIIITKLPFQVPSSPILKYKSTKLEKQNKNPFYELSLPYASIKLKQGFGRLIRKEDDIGVCFIFDSRIIKKSYGKQILNTLPKTQVYFDNFQNLYINYKKFLKKHKRV